MVQTTQAGVQVHENSSKGTGVELGAETLPWSNPFYYHTSQF